MTSLNFSESEPVINARARNGSPQLLAGNSAFYSLQGQTKKKGVGQYAWVALPIGAIAIVGIVMATSPSKTDNANNTPAPAQVASTSPAVQVVDPSQATDASGANTTAALSASPAQAPAMPVKIAKAALATIPVHRAARASSGGATVNAASAAPAETISAPEAITPAPAAPQAAPVVSPPTAEPATIVPSAPVEAAPAAAESVPAQ